MKNMYAPLVIGLLLLALGLALSAAVGKVASPDVVVTTMATGTLKVVTLDPTSAFRTPTATGHFGTPTNTPIVTQTPAATYCPPRLVCEP